MPPNLPDPIPRYFAAQNALDEDMMMDCFAPDAVVHDEGGTYIGRKAIRAWKHNIIAKYGISIDPLEASQKDDNTVVVARVAGNFPGSPANLTYTFGVSLDGLIRTLDIH